MIVWSGLGFLVALFTFGSALVCQALIDSTYGAGYYSAHQWTVGVALLCAGGLSWIVSSALNLTTDRVVIDKASGREMRLDPGRHSLFFVPVRYWSGILGILGLVLCILDGVK